MKTLYDVLGVSAQATPAQIELAYKFCLDSLLQGGGNSPEDDLNRGKALKEAYAVLSSPIRRAEYDERLKARDRVVYEVVENDGFPWVKALLATLVVLTAFGIYTYQARKMEVERVALETARIKAEAELAAKRAQEMEARLEQQRLQELRLAEAQRQREIEQARREGLQVHESLRRMDEQAARERDREEKERQRAEQQARYEKQREEQAAQARKRNEIAAMERALRMPLPRY